VRRLSSKRETSKVVRNLETRTATSSSDVAVTVPAALTPVDCTRSTRSAALPSVVNLSSVAEVNNGIHTTRPELTTRGILHISIALPNKSMTAIIPCDVGHHSIVNDDHDDFRTAQPRSGRNRLSRKGNCTDRNSRKVLDLSSARSETETETATSLSLSVHLLNKNPVEKDQTKNTIEIPVKPCCTSNGNLSFSKIKSTSTISDDESAAVDFNKRLEYSCPLRIAPMPDVCMHHSEPELPVARRKRTLGVKSNAPLVVREISTTTTITTLHPTIATCTTFNGQIESSEVSVCLSNAKVNNDHETISERELNNVALSENILKRKAQSKARLNEDELRSSVLTKRLRVTLVPLDVRIHVKDARKVCRKVLRVKLERLAVYDGGERLNLSERTSESETSQNSGLRLIKSSDSNEGLAETTRKKSTFINPSVLNINSILEVMPHISSALEYKPQVTEVTTIGVADVENADITLTFVDEDVDLTQKYSVDRLIENSLVRRMNDLCDTGRDITDYGCREDDAQFEGIDVLYKFAFLSSPDSRNSVEISPPVPDSPPESNAVYSDLRKSESNFGSPGMVYNTGGNSGGSPSMVCDNVDNSEDLIPSMSEQVNQTKSSSQLEKHNQNQTSLHSTTAVVDNLKTSRTSLPLCESTEPISPVKNVNEEQCTQALTTKNCDNSPVTRDVEPPPSVSTVVPSSGNTSNDVQSCSHSVSSDSSFVFIAPSPSYDEINATKVSHKFDEICSENQEVASSQQSSDRLGMVQELLSGRLGDSHAFNPSLRKLEFRAAPPTFQEVRMYMVNHGIPSVPALEAFCSDPKDLPLKPK